MDAAVMRLLLPILFLYLAACAGFTTTDKEEDQKWWDGFYGRKSDEGTQDCAFYGTCKDSGSGW